MKHTTLGELPAIADREITGDAGNASHLASCPECRQRLAAMERDRNWVKSALGQRAVAAPIDTTAAWRRLEATWVPATSRSRVVGCRDPGPVSGARLRRQPAAGLPAAHLQVINVSPADLAQIETTLKRYAPAINVRGSTC